jgi:mediator of RNA polymerase II transcription subunit 5
MATDLITAAFDILANAMYRSEPAQTMFALKSFLVNKVPILLIQLSASIFPMTPELSITQALRQVDPNAFPSFSQGFDDMLGNDNSLSDVRLDFLNSCALHGLIAANTVERLLGEAPMKGPPPIKHTKKDLLAHFKNNFELVNMYITELSALDGNGGAIVGAVTEVCHLDICFNIHSLSSVHFPSLRDSNDYVSQNDLQLALEETAGIGHIATVHLIRQPTPAVVPILG